MAPRRRPTDEQPTASGDQPRPEAWLQREARILDAATALLLRWGYRKTTIDDVAREAGVGKGTIYLHWSDKNALFLAALQREQQQVTETVKQRIAADPEGGRVHRLVIHSMAASLASPLIAAILRGNSDIFNGFVGAYDPTVIDQMASNSDSFFAHLQQSGLVRGDIPASVISAMMSALKIGMINLPHLLGEAHTPSIEQLTEAMSDMIRRWLEPERAPPASDAGKQWMNDYLDTI